MASNTRQTTARRNAKKASLGKKRKNKVRKFGSTAPDLPLSVPNANERKQTKASK